MLGEILPQELETFEVPAEEDGVVLLRHLEGFHGFRINRLDFFPSRPKAAHPSSELAASLPSNL